MPIVNGGKYEKLLIRLIDVNSNKISYKNKHRIKQSNTVILRTRFFKKIADNRTEDTLPLTKNESFVLHTMDTNTIRTIIVSR
jgi:hypothetical protein